VIEVFFRTTIDGLLISLDCTEITFFVFLYFYSKGAGAGSLHATDLGCHVVPADPSRNNEEEYRQFRCVVFFCIITMLHDELGMMNNNMFLVWGWIVR
jgi:hypothetical protein